MTGELIDKSFEGMLGDMRRRIDELSRRLGSPAVGMTQIFPEPGSLSNAFVDETGTIVMSGGSGGDWVTIPGIFRDDFRGYKIVFSLQTSGGISNQPQYRLMRGNAMDGEAGTYPNARSYITTGGATSSAFSYGAYGLLSNTSHPSDCTGTMEVIAPYKAFERTAVTFSTQHAETHHWGGMSFLDPAPQDGIAFLRGPAGVSTDGWLKVFGYR